MQTQTVKSFARRLGFALAGLLAALPARPCTTCVLQGDGRLYFARNLDWIAEEGLVIVNPRELAKTAFVTPPHVPAKWTAKYGSVTFNQFGREQPFGGMNEAGLVVEQMMLMESEYPPADTRPEIGMLQWMQYQLDTCRTVAEVLAADERVRIEQPSVPARVHYLICDAQGGIATIEFLGGKQVVHRGKDLPFRALANDTYASSLAHARANPAPETTPAQARDRQSLSRFAHAATRAARFTATTPERDLAYAFDTLEQVCQGEFTVWRIVYDIGAKRIHFRTRGTPQERVLDLKQLDFACQRTVQFADLKEAPTAGAGLKFRDLTEAEHRKYLDALLDQPRVKQTFGDLSSMKEGLLLTLQGYTCATP